MFGNDLFPPLRLRAFGLVGAGVLATFACQIGAQPEVKAPQVELPRAGADTETANAEAVARKRAVERPVSSQRAGTTSRKRGERKQGATLKPASVEGKARLAAPWSYVLPVDHGVRSDRSGDGHFRAPRYHGEHNGLDLLAPIGTPTYAACDGKAKSGTSASFGRWVHVICQIPEALDATGSLYASFFYAHLKRVRVPTDWVPVKAGKTVGAVGKTGNARGATISPHLHLELIVQSGERAAMRERHSGRDHSMVARARSFFQALDAECLDPHGFAPNSGRVRRARRADPFLVLTCLASDKPDFQPAPLPLRDASTAWSELYSARNFNVDRGPDIFLLSDSR